MTEIESILKSKYGIHARPAKAIYSSAVEFSSAEIYLVDPDTGTEYCAKNILNIMSLAKNCGDPIIIRATGAEEERAAFSVAKVISEFEIEE